MNLSKNDLMWAATRGVIAPEQVEPLWKVIQERTAPSSHFNFATVSYYLGSLIVIIAMGWLITLGWESLGGKGIFFVSIIYTLFFSLMGHLLWSKPPYRVLGGLFVTLAVCMIPLMVYGLEKWWDLWPLVENDDQNSLSSIRGNWIYIEVSTIFAALIAIYFIRFSFLMAPLCLSIWFLSMDLLPFLRGQEAINWQGQLWLSFLIGAGMIMLAIVIDRFIKNEDFAFWAYLFGLLAFWISLTLLIDEKEGHRFLYGLTNAGLIFIGVFLKRAVFFVFGGLGVFGYLCYLAYDVFPETFFFPLILSFTGLAIIGLGVLYQKIKRHS